MKNLLSPNDIFSLVLLEVILCEPAVIILGLSFSEQNFELTPELGHDLLYMSQENVYERESPGTAAYQMVVAIKIFSVHSENRNATNMHDVSESLQPVPIKYWYVGRPFKISFGLTY